MKPPRTPNGFAERQSIRDWMDRFNALINFIAWLLPVVFAWLLFKEINIEPILQQTSPDIVRKIALVIYYFCWLYGCKLDARRQEAVYIKNPHKEMMPWRAFLFLIAFLTVTFMLLWASENDKYFALALTAFAIWDICAWKLSLLYYVGPVIRASEKEYRRQKNHVELEALKIVTNFVYGIWNWPRRISAAIILLCANAFTLANAFPEAIPASVHQMTFNSIGVLPSLLLLLYVLVLEAIIWTARLRVGISLRMLRTLSTNYELRPKH